ncbi:unnamed protein product [Darwinula stevensoni]|uniref:UDP-galactose transporter n=1 Tax=Darwinula stevensoni TaxID=69355 RepID=A0A7R8X3R9_9CRUS|nr:unnamed protein product [Darwinula stevensoni]CAG0878857.1 unnamed protein product [Darwinula stevensoni]
MLGPKCICLVALTIVTSSMVILTRYSRSVIRDESDERYSAAVAVFFTEILKFFAFFLVLFVSTSGELRYISIVHEFFTCVSSFIIDFRAGLSWVESANIFKREILQERGETAKLAIPGACYTLQNNLLYVALTNLNAGIYSVTAELKILTTAVFSILLLNRRLKFAHWICLLVLTVGVSLVQYSSHEENCLDPADCSAKNAQMNQSLGLVSVLVACVMSGFAGTYFERALKHGSNSRLSVRSMQLGLWSLLFAAFGVGVESCRRSSSLLAGFAPLTWAVVFIQAVNGVTVAATMKYADNILKCFATAISIILSSFVSFYVLGDLHPSSLFLLGSILVISSTFSYGNLKKPASSRFSPVLKF